MMDWQGKHVLLKEDVRGRLRLKKGTILLVKAEFPGTPILTCTLLEDSTQFIHLTKDLLVLQPRLQIKTVAGPTQEKEIQYILDGRVVHQFSEESLNSVNKWSSPFRTTITLIAQSLGAVVEEINETVLLSPEGAAPCLREGMDSERKIPSGESHEKAPPPSSLHPEASSCSSSSFS